MFDQIIRLVVDTAGLLFAGGCLLRLWMQWLRIGVHNPVGGFVLALTDWIVLPLRRIIPGLRGIDWASVVATILIALAAVALVYVGAGLSSGIVLFPAPQLVIGLALVWIVKWALYVALAIIVIVAALSWFNPYSPVFPIFEALAAPVMRPMRKLMPRTSRFDFSPLIVFLLIDIALIVLNAISLKFFGVY